jgi:hypothetical protein
VKNRENPPFFAFAKENIFEKSRRDNKGLDSMWKGNPYFTPLFLGLGPGRAGKISRGQRFHSRNNERPEE